VRYRLVAIAAADGGDFQMKARVFRMAAVVDEIFRSFFRRPYLGKYSVGCVVLTEMGAETALTFVHL